MVNSKGKITAERIAEQSALEFGQKFARSLEPTINKIATLENQLKNTKKEFDGLIIKKYKLSKEFNNDVKTQQQLMNLLNKKDALNKQVNDTLVKNEKLEQERLKTKKLLLDTIRKEEQAQRRKEQAQKRANKKTIEETELLKELKKNERERAKESLGLVGAYQKLNKQRTEAQKRLADLLATNQKDVKNQKTHQKEIAKTRAEYERLNKRVLAIDKSTNNFTKNIGNYKSALKGLSGSFRSLISAFGVTGGIYTFVNVVKNGVDIVRNFGATMSNVAGIYRTSRKDIAGLEEKIIAVAGASVKTATEVAQLAESLATLGKSPDEVEKLLEPVNNLSIGLKASSDEAGEFLVQTMNAFGASADEAEKYADVLATVRTSTSLDFQKMKDSFQYLSPISKALGKDVAYTGALIGLLADNGIKAERAGRLMGTAQQRLAKNGKTLNSALEELNEAKRQGSNENELLALSSKLFGEHASALGLILADNTGKVEENAKKIRENGGALQDLVNEQLQSLDAHFKILNSRWEEYILNTDKSTGASNKLKKGIKYLSDNLERVINFVINTVKVWLTYKATIVAVSLITRTYTALTTALGVAKAFLSGGINGATTAMKGFNLATKSNPIGFLIALLTSAVTAFIAFRDGADLAAQAQRDFNKARENRNKEEDEKARIVNERINKEIEAIDERTRAELVGVKNQVKANKIREKATAEKIAMLEREKAEVDKLKDSYKKTLDAEIKNESKRLGRKVDKVTTDRGGKLTASYNKKNDLSNAIAKRIDYLKTSQKEEEQAIKDANKAKDKLSKAQQKQAEKEAEERRKKILTDAYNLAKFEAEQEAKHFKQIQDNENESYINRINASKKYKAKQKELADKEFEYKLRLSNNFTVTEIEELIENGESKKELFKRLSSEELLIYKKLQAKKQEIEKKQQEDAGKLYLSRLKRLTELEEESQKNLNTKIEELRKKFQNGTIKSVEEYEKELAKIKFENSRDLLDKQIDFLDKELKNYADNTEKKLAIEKALAKAKKDLSDLNFENSKNKNKNKIFEDLQKIKGQITDTSDIIANAFGINQSVVATFFDSIINGFDKSKDKAERFAEIAKASVAMVGEIGNAVYQNRINEIDEEIAKSDEYYNGEIEKAQTRYDQDGRLLEDGEKKKKILEEQKEKDREKLEKKKRKEQIKQAKFNKAISMLEIGLNTASAIMKLWVSPGFPTAIPLTAIVGTLGIAQLATVASTPLPKYKSGTTAKTPHLAIVGDGGRSEVIEKPTGETYITPATDTITYLEKGDIVHPSLEIFKQRKGFTADNYEEMLRLSRLSDFKKVGKLAQQYQEQVIINNQFNENKMAQAMERNMFLLKGELKSAIVEGFKSVKIHNHNNIDLDDYIGGWERG